MQSITITGARVNNLKNVSLKLPKNKLIVITGLSGSGKSSLAFDTIYAEGQRRYAESLNAYARQFMDMQDKPDVDDITGLSPTIAIDQKNTSTNPRSTIGTMTEMYDGLRLLFARLGIQHCPACGIPIQSFTKGQITELLRKEARKKTAVEILAPVIVKKSIAPKELFSYLEKTKRAMFRLNGSLMPLAKLKAYPFQKHVLYDIDIVVGTTKESSSIAQCVETALELGSGSLVTLNEDTGEERTYATAPTCPSCERSFQRIEPRSFSFNSPHGACGRCTGLGTTLEVDPDLVIPNPRLTLAEGAIQPWMRIVGNQSLYAKLLEVVSAAHGFSTHVPVQELPAPVMQLLLYGTDGQQYNIDGKSHTFEGIVPNLSLRHSQTTSEYVRKEIEGYMREKRCSICEGKRLKEDSRAVRIDDTGITDILSLSIEECREFFDPSSSFCSALKKQKNGTNQIAEPILSQLRTRIENLLSVGLSYLSLDRSMMTLSGGEAQRVRLSMQLSTGLTGVIYILDEPSIGLHPKDNGQLIQTIKQLRDLENTVIVVEHDSAMMEAADLIVDVGPGAGDYGGEIIGIGTPKEIKKQPNSLTGAYLAHTASISPTTTYRKGTKHAIEIRGASAHNLKQIDVSIPLGKLVCVTGVSGSGKTTLIHDILGRALSKHFFRAKAEPGAHTSITGLEHINKVIDIDQTPIGRTPRSNPATYTGVFGTIRDLYAEQPEAKLRGYDAGSFSFNVKGGGRCEACVGEGYVRIPMQFLTDVFIECAECEGQRYTKETLEIMYHGKTIADVLRMTVDDACSFFSNIPSIAEKLLTLKDVGLGYITLGQPATKLSGGEAQRVKLATELSRKSTGNTLYILDEPTSGLHFEDIKKLLHVLNTLVDKENTVLVIEHNLDVIKSADWIIDLGPEGGKEGGMIVAEGTPRDVAKKRIGYTAEFLYGMFR